jgi:Na+-driven multidrug efflux pump
MAGQLVAIGVPASAQMLIRVVAQMVLVGFVALGGTAALAAYGIGNQLTGLILVPCFAFAMSAAILTGQNLGAGKPARAEKSALASVGLATAVAAAVILFLVLFAPAIVAKFDATPEVVRLGTLYLYICAPAFLFTPMGMVLSRAMGGAGVSWAPLIVTAVVLLGVRVPLAYLMTVAWGMGTVGVYWAIAIPTVLEGSAEFFVFMTGVWKHKKL